MLYAVLFAAGISLLVSITVFPASSNTLLAQQVVNTLGTTSDLMLATLHLFQADSRSIHALKDYRLLCERVLSLREKLSMEVSNLRPAYEDARYEITFALFPLDRYEAFIDLALKLQTILVSRMGLKISRDGHHSELAMIPDFERDDEGTDKPPYLRTLVDELGRMNVLALDTICRSLATSSYLPRAKTSNKTGQSGKTVNGLGGIHELYRDKEMEQIQRRLDEIVETFRNGIVEALDKALQHEGRTEHAHRLFRANVSPHPQNAGPWDVTVPP